MKKNLQKIAAALAACILLAIPCGCGEDSTPGTLSDSDLPAVSVSDVSGSDVSASDAGEQGWYDALSSEKRAVADVVLRSVEAMNARDIDAYMATVDPESKVYNTTREDAEWVFGRYRLAVTIDDLSVDSIGKDTAVVTVTQTTLPLTLEDVLVEVSVSGSDVVSLTDLNPLTGTDYTYLFDPCQTVLTHRMVMRGGEWYVSSTVIESYREISTQWDLLAAVSAADPSAFNYSATGVQTVSGADATSGSDAVSVSDQAE